MKKELPILFNSEMVKAIIEGRKTQTRRPIKITKKWSILEFDEACNYMAKQNGWRTNLAKSGNRFGIAKQLTNPFAAEYLWVKETFSALHTNEVFFKADLPEASIDWTPSIHMPRACSRILLKVKRVWVERIQDIEATDCVAEGIVPLYYDENQKIDWKPRNIVFDEFEQLWKSCGYEWDSNPFVWCCEFEKQIFDFVGMKYLEPEER